ncbi:MAG TPA: hypothetical protein VFL94_12275 [Actinomycetales bacterium]|nr:hypothetical protein [Actinomycetales bacterium]
MSTFTSVIRSVGRHRTRSTIAAGGVAALCFGAAAPAYACHVTDGGQQANETTKVAFSADPATRTMPTTDQVRSVVLGHIDRLVAQLEDARTKVAASDRLSDDEQAAWLERIDAAAAALSDLRDEVAADSTTGEIWTDLRAFWKDHRDLMGVTGKRWHHHARHVRVKHEAESHAKAESRWRSESQAGKRSDRTVNVLAADGRRDDDARRSRWADRRGDDHGWYGGHRYGTDHRGDDRHRGHDGRHGARFGR